MIDIDRANDIWTLTLNRPDKANALTHAMLADIAQATQDAKGTAKALILTGAGKVFCAGMDLDAAKSDLPTDPVWETASSAIADFDGLSIAALNGTLAGGAFGMALACDIRLAAPHAKFFYPVMRLGFLPQPSDPQRLRTLIGPARAKMILMAGAKIEAPEALAWGLIDRIAPVDDLKQTALDLTQGVQAATPAHRSAIKRMINQ